MDTTQVALTRIYSDTLSAHPLHWFDRSREHEPEFAKLSGVFIPGTSLAYQQARGGSLWLVGKLDAAIIPLILERIVNYESISKEGLKTFVLNYRAGTSFSVDGKVENRTSERL